MLIFAPQKLIHAVEIVKQQHPLTGSLTGTMSGADLKELVLRIDGREMEELEALALSLSRRQVFALCGYLPNNAYHVDLGKITRVISFRMNSDLFLRLVQLWQRHPQCLECLSLAGKFDTDELRPQDFPVKKGLLAQWSGTTLPLLTVARTINDLGQGFLFEEKYASIGLEPRTPLEFLSYRSFLSGASAAQMVREGDDRIYDSMENATNETRSEILCQVLKNSLNDYDFLIQFPKLYRIAYSLWGEPNRRSFPKPELFVAYSWWFNYHQVSKALSGDPRRIRFWSQYLSRCQCTHVPAHGMLIFRFEDYVVTDFRSMGPSYIFRADYFDAYVQYEIVHHTTAVLKSWMYHDSDNIDRITHMANWEIKQSRALSRIGIR